MSNTPHAIFMTRAAGALAGWAALTAFTLGGCAHGPPSPAEEGVSQPIEAPSAEASPTPIVPTDGPARSPAERCGSWKAPGVIDRAALVEVVDQGLGMWLQGVKVEALVEKGKFIGWRIQTLHLTNPCYADVDLRPGDLVTSVNGQSIAREGKAFEVFSSLRTAGAIEVDFVRAGKSQKLKLEIQ